MCSYLGNDDGSPELYGSLNFIQCVDLCHNGDACMHMMITDA